MVAYCGDTTAGTYVSTLDLVDIATGWTEHRAVWGKGERGVINNPVASYRVVYYQFYCHE